MNWCPVCEARRDVRYVESANGLDIWACPDCQVQFSDPSTPEFRYDLAYTEGDSTTGGVYFDWLQEFDDRLARAGCRSGLAAEQQAGLQWLERHLPPGVAVLDLGCGLGEFLAALRNSMFVALGLDLAPAPVDRLRKEGFAVAVGTIDHYPADWPPPAAVTMYHVLEHLPNPVPFLRNVRARFPQALLVIAVPSQRRFSLRGGKREEFDYPPHHLTRWMETSLRRALTHAGYTRVEIRSLALDPKELSGSGLGCVLHRWLAGRNRRPQGEVRRKSSSSSVVLSCRATVLAKRLLYGVPSLYLRARGWTGGSLMGFARPN